MQISLPSLTFLNFDLFWGTNHTVSCWKIFNFNSVWRFNFCRVFRLLNMSGILFFCAIQLFVLPIYLQAERWVCWFGIPGSNIFGQISSPFAKTFSQIFFVLGWVGQRIEWTNIEIISPPLQWTLSAKLTSVLPQPYPLFSMPLTLPPTARASRTPQLDRTTFTTAFTMISTKERSPDIYSQRSLDFNCQRICLHCQWLKLMMRQRTSKLGKDLV